jgi:arsenite methyltransferase
MTDRSTEEIQQAVRQRYAEVSRSVAGKFRYLTGKAGAAALGYDLSVFGGRPRGYADVRELAQSH